MAHPNAPTIDPLLADPLIQKVMRADRVEPQALKSMLHGTARRIAERAARDRRADRTRSRPARLVSQSAAPDAARGARDGRRMRSIPLRLILLR